MTCLEQGILTAADLQTSVTTNAPYIHQSHLQKPLEASLNRDPIGSVTASLFNLPLPGHRYAMPSHTVIVLVWVSISEFTPNPPTLFFVVSEGAHHALCPFLCENITHCWVALSVSPNKELSKKARTMLCSFLT
jgi:hypothetical protein